MPEVTAVSVPADADRENEDAFALGEGVAVVVDGAGLPKELRSGCRHSVHWYADALARAFRNHLDRRDSEMPHALAVAIAEVVDSHAAGCRLAEGSPSATVAAWRLHLDTVNPPGMSGDSSAWEGWSHVREYVEEVPGRAA